MSTTVNKITISLMRIVVLTVVIQNQNKKSFRVTGGLDKSIQYSDFIQDERFRLYLLDSEKNGVTVKIPRACQTHCFYFGSPCVPDPKHPTRKTIRNVCTLPFKQSVLKTCDQRNDKWAEEVRM